MNANDLLSYYEQELAFIRELGAEFASAHPKIAARLRLSEHMVEDPHVARMMEAFALANARFRHKLDDDFPEISDALLNMFHPHFLAPIPSMSIIQIKPKQDKILKEITYEPGVILRSSTRYGPECVFRTCYPVKLYPIEVSKAALQSKPYKAPMIREFNAASSVLHISLAGYSKGSILADYDIDALRFYINEQIQDANGLYELLFNHTIAIAFANSPHDPDPIILDNHHLHPVGFGANEGLLPYDKRTFMGYRYLLEFFTLPEKFLFFELIDLKEKIARKCNKKGENLEIYIYFKESHSHLEKTINSNSLALGCTPIVNLFEAQGEPFELTHTQNEYLLAADNNKLASQAEVYSIQRLTATEIDKKWNTIELKPFYGLKNSDTDYYYHVSRKAGWEGNHYRNSHSEIFVSFSDIHFNPMVLNRYEIKTELLCTNANLPRLLPFGGGEPELIFKGHSESAIDKAICLLPITPSHHPFLKKGARWKLVSHLTLNHISLTNDAESVNALKNLLKIYDFGYSMAHQNLIEGLSKLECSKTTARNPNIKYGNVFWQGSKIKLTVEEDKFTGIGIFMFGSILERFLALYCAINSFTELEIRTGERELVYRWRPRAGEKTLI